MVVTPRRDAQMKKMMRMLWNNARRMSPFYGNYVFLHFLQLNAKAVKTNPINGKFELIALPYAEDALAPVISAETIRFHHGKHLHAYVNNLNAALAGSPLEGLP